MGVPRCRTMFKSKIHRATVTQAGIWALRRFGDGATPSCWTPQICFPGELVHIADITNGPAGDVHRGERGPG